MLDRTAKDKLWRVVRKFDLIIIAAVITIVCVVIYTCVSTAPSASRVGDGSLYRVGEDKEYGVVCYKSTITQGISCVKVK